MTFKSGFANENSAVRWVRAPGPLREAAGFSYQEFSNLEKPLALKGDPFHVRRDANKVRYWAEFLMPEHAKATRVLRSSVLRKMARHHRKPIRLRHAALRRHLLSDALQQAVVRDVLRTPALPAPISSSRQAVRVKHGTNHDGKRIHYYLNYSGSPANFTYAYAAGRDLLTGHTVAQGRQCQPCAVGLGHTGRGQVEEHLNRSMCVVVELKKCMCWTSSRPEEPRPPGQWWSMCRRRASPGPTRPRGTGAKFVCPSAALRDGNSVSVLPIAWLQRSNHKGAGAT